MATKQKPQKRESRYVRMARIAYELAQETLPKYSHRNSPKKFTQWQLAACVMIGFHLDLSYRDMEEWLLATDKVCEVLELEEVPDHSTLSRMYKRLKSGDYERLNASLLTKMAVEEELIAGDATGFAMTQASRHYQSRSGRQYSFYAKGFYVVGCLSQFILGWRFGWGPSSDVPYLHRLRRLAAPYGRKIGRWRAWFFLGDKGFDGSQARPNDLIPPRKGKVPVRRPDRVLRDEMVDAARLDGIYGQRWIAETVISVIKRKSGSALRSRRFLNQYHEVAMKGLVYNIYL